MNLRLLPFFRSSKQETIGLPDCALKCYQTAEPDASNWGCTGSGYTCLCDISWFFANYNNCVRQSCSAVDSLTADLQIQSHCDALNKRDLSSAASFAEPVTVFAASPSPLNTPLTTSAPLTLQTITTNIQTPTTLSAAASAAGATATSASTAAISSAAGTAGGATAASSTSTSTATSSPTPGPTSGLTQSAKIGIGLGVPLGVIVLALLAYALYWFGKQRGGQSRDKKITGLKESEKESADAAGTVNPTTLEGGELHGEHVVHHPRELPGSPGYVRRELP